MVNGYRYRITFKGDGKEPSMLLSDSIEDRKKIWRAFKEMVKKVEKEYKVLHADVFEYEDEEPETDFLTCAVGYWMDGAAHTTYFGSSERRELDRHACGFLRNLDCPVIYVKIYDPSKAIR